MSPRKRTPKTDPSKAVAYLRVSTEEQHVGPEAQRDAIEVWARREGIEITSWHADFGVSGGAPLDRRPAFLEAIDALTTEQAGVLVVMKRDRLARDVMLAGMAERLCERQGARILSADGVSAENTPEGGLMRGIVDLFAQYERALIRARTSAALAAKKARGQRTGSVPLGYRVAEDGVSLEVDEREREAVELAKQLRHDGHSFGAIARALEQRGHTPRSGGRWYAMQAKRMCEFEAPAALIA